MPSATGCAWRRSPRTSPSSTATFQGLPATRWPDTSSPRAAGCRSSCSPLPTASTTRPPASSSAPTTTSPSRSSSGSSCSGSGHSTAGVATTDHRFARSRACGWTRSAARSTVMVATSRSRGSSSRCSTSSSLPKAAWSAPKSCSSGPGTRTPTRSPTPYGSRFRGCASDSANHGSSSRCPASATASSRDRAARAARVDRVPGLSVRLKLTLSYAGFLMLAGILLLATVWVFRLRYVPDQARFGPGPVPFSPTRSDLLEAFAPRAAQALTVLLVVGLVGGWLLAGRMLAPLTRITEATRIAATGELSHRIRLEGRSDEFRELADAFDTMLARLEGHVAEHQRFAANASHELRTPLAITQTLLDVARRDPDRDQVELIDRLHDVNARAIDLTEALLLLSRADQRSFRRDHVDLSLIAEEATETLLPLAEKRGLTIETSGDVTPTIGSHALLLQLSTNLVHNAIVHNLPAQGAVWVRTSVQPRSVSLAVENTGETLTPQLASTLAEPF